MLDDQGVTEKFGVKPNQILDYLSIIGDQADNIPGLTGVGPKTAVKWLQAWDNLEELIANAGRVTPKRFCSMIYEKRVLLIRNREIIKLDATKHEGDINPSPPNVEKICEILEIMEMKKSIDEVKVRYSSA
jgi:DNA polymerase-1